MEPITFETLIDQATNEVVDRFLSITDLSDHKIKVQEETLAIGTGAEVRPDEILQVYESEFEQAKADIIDEYQQMAKKEVIKAVKQAELEMFRHRLQLDRLNECHRRVFERLNFKSAILVLKAGDDFITAETLKDHENKSALRNVRDMQMRHAQELHFTALCLCFKQHLVSEATAVKLARILEVK